MATRRADGIRHKASSSATKPPCVELPALLRLRRNRHASIHLACHVAFGSSQRRGRIARSANGSSQRRSQIATLAGGHGRVPEMLNQCRWFLRLIAALVVIFVLVGCGDSENELTCSSAVTRVHAVQGTASQSRWVGRGPVAVEGVVTRVQEQRGVFIQEPADRVDRDARTSEGLLVLTNMQWPPGTILRARGLVEEIGRGDRTTTAVRAAEVRECGVAELPPPFVVRATSMNLGEWERLEAMRVRFERALTVIDTHDLDDLGQLHVSLNGFAVTPTEVFRPGRDVRDAHVALLKSTLILDDASDAPFPRTPFELKTNDVLPRVGDRLGRVEGVVDGSDDIRIQMRTIVDLQPEGRAIPALPAVGGDIRVAAFNVLNLFNGNGRGGGFPTSRGAATADELKRQLDKLASAIGALDADVVGLMELENDGQGPDSAIAQLAAAVNASGDLEYAIVMPREAMGEDEIAVGMIYRPDVLRPVGPARTRSDPPFDDYNRQPLLQTFAVGDQGWQVTVVVNHFKSKGCREATELNLDRGDGQGCWNAKRVEAARAIATWSRELGVERTLLIGDLNAYGREDPVLALQDAGFQNLTASLTPRQRYSFVFRGRAGALDHALATPRLAAEVTGIGVWHINAGAPDWLDYRRDARRSDRYDTGPLRSSDHDPILIGIDIP